MTCLATAPKETEGRVLEVIHVGVVDQKQLMTFTPRR